VIVLPDIDLYYPDDVDQDLAAVFSLRGGDSGMSINYGYVGRRVSGIVADGAIGGAKFISEQFMRMMDWIIDSTNIDQDWLDELGRDYSPMWGADGWHRVIAPNGYIDRYKAAGETLGFIAAFAILRAVTGRVGVSGLASFAGGQFSSFKQRNYRAEVLDALENDERHDLLMEETLFNTFDRTKQRNLDQADAISLAFKGIALNNKDQTLQASRILDNVK